MTRTLKRYGVNRDSWTVLRAILKSGEPFNRVTDTFHGEVFRAGDRLMLGQLPIEWRDRILKAERDGELDYVVYSYHTPIAWIAKDGGLIRWVYPPVRYSQTTAKHQGRLRPAMGDYLDR